MNAFLFPGQGTQRANVYEKFIPYENIVSEIFEIASDVSSKDVKALSASAPLEELIKPENAQIVVTAINCAFLKILETKGVLPDIAAGHSLGQFSALVCAKVLSPYNCFKLVTRRAEITGKVKKQGVLCSVIGLDYETVKTLCIENNASIALYNSPLQTVVGGEKSCIENLNVKAQELGALKTQFLPVANAFHTELMREAEEEFAVAVNGVRFSEPNIPLLLNCTGTYAKNADDVKKDVINQLCHTVMWSDCMKTLVSLSPTVYEVGLGNVLSGLIKKHKRSLTVRSVEDII